MGLLDNFRRNIMLKMSMKKLSSSDLARLMNRPYNQVFDLVYSSHDILLRDVELVCQVLDVDPREMLGGVKMGKPWSDIELEIIAQMRRDAASLRRRADEIDEQIKAFGRKRDSIFTEDLPKSMYDAPFFAIREVTHTSGRNKFGE